MTLTLHIAPELERELRQAAEQAGVALDAYVLRLLQQNLQAARAPERLSVQEAELLQQINRSLSALEWQRYYALLDKRRAETLTPDEQAELITLSDQIEDANVRRFQSLAELARLRRTTVKALVAQLGLKPLAHV